MPTTQQIAPTQELNRLFGVELEFTSRLGTRATGTAIQEAGVALTNHNGFACHQHNNNDWQLKTDATAGLELVSRVLEGEDGLNDLSDVVGKMERLKANRRLGLKITRYCGFHVHVDVADFSWKNLRNLIKMVLKYEDVILGFQPTSRACNRWAAKIRGRNIFTRLINARNEHTFRRLLNGTSKYYGLNLTNFMIRGTVEFRYGAGTLSAAKVKAWVIFLMGLVETAKVKQVSVKIGGRLFRHLRGDALYHANILRQYKGWSDGLKDAKKTLVKRFKKFSGDRAEETIRYNGDE